MKVENVELEPKTLSEDQARKRAFDIIKKAFRNSYGRLNDKSVADLTLPGLWAASISVLLSCLEVKDVITLLTNRSNMLSNHAENENSPPIRLPAKQFARYAQDVALASEVIVDAIGQVIPQLEKENLDDRLPESVIDCAIYLLVNSWGPVHLRRAMTEQVAAFVSDSPAPIVFMVPRDNVKPKHEPDHVVESKADKVDIDEPQHVPARSEKTIRIFMEYQLSEASEQSAEWGVVIYKTDIREMTELHILKGKIASKNWMLAPLAALVEALKAISHEDVSCAITVETTHEYIVKGMDGGDEKKAFRSPESIIYWNDIDALVRGRDIKCRSVAANLSDNLQNICDMAIQRSPIDIV